MPPPNNGNQPRRNGRRRVSRPRRQTGGPTIPESASDRPRGRPRRAIPRGVPRARRPGGPSDTNPALRRAAVRASAAVGRLSDPNFVRLMGAITDPFHCPPVRLPLAAGRPTAANRLFAIEKAGSTPVGTSELPLAANVGFSAVFRNPNRGYIKYEVKGAGADSQYVFKFDNGGQLTTNAPGPAPGDYLRPACLDLASGWDRHGSRACTYTGSDGIPRVYLDVECGTSTTTLLIGGLAPSANTTFNLSRLWKGNVTTTQVVIPVDGTGLGAIAVPAQQPGYYAVQAVTDLSGRTLAAQYSTTCPYSFRHRPVPGLENIIPVAGSARVTAASQMISDRTAPIYAQGSVVEYQAAGDEDWADLAGLAGTVATDSNGYDELADINLARNGDYHKGRYNFLKYNGIQDAVMAEIAVGSGNDRYPAPVDLTADMDFLVMSYDATNATQLNGQWTFCWHLEFETKSQLYPVAPSDIHPSVMDDVTYAMGYVDQDYENESHLKKLWRAIQGGARMVGKIAPMIGAAYPPAMPAAALASGVANLLL